MQPRLLTIVLYSGRPIQDNFYHPMTQCSPFLLHKTSTVLRAYHCSIPSLRISLPFSFFVPCSSSPITWTQSCSHRIDNTSISTTLSYENHAFSRYITFSLNQKLRQRSPPGLIKCSMSRLLALDGEFLARPKPKQNEIHSA